LELGVGAIHKQPEARRSPRQCTPNAPLNQRQAKAYTTRVGAGPYPTEIFGDLGEKIREVSE